MKIGKSGIHNVPGFLSLGKNIGIKKVQKDFGIIFSECVCSAAGVFTTNTVKGAPLFITQDHLKDGRAQAIVVNSGNANVGTGEKGKEDAKKIVTLVAQELEINEKNVLVASTGIIGKMLPMEKFEKGILGIKRELSTSDNFAEAILTTDKIKKEMTVHGKNFTISGVAKGSGMIHPNMATMLAFLVTDARVSSTELKKMLKKSVDQSFNMVSVDMDTSTSDMVLILANGSAGKVDNAEFQDALTIVCIELAKLIAQDGEGATKLIVVETIAAKSEEDAKKISKNIICSPLVKCALFGSDPNWGRILCAIGNSGAFFVENKLKISINGNPIVEHGVEVRNFNSYTTSKSIEKKTITTILIDLGLGKAHATAYGCDMSYDYIKINAQYST